jgi:PRC-barrel domain
MRTLRQRFVLLAAVVALAQIGAVPGSAQAPGGPGPNDGDASPGLTSVLSQSRLDSVLGREVRTRVEEDVGRIVDILADRQSRVQAAVIEFGGFLGIGTRKIAVDWSAISFENDGKRTIVIVDLSRDQLRLAPEYKPNEQPMIVRTSD